MSTVTSMASGQAMAFIIYVWAQTRILLFLKKRLCRSSWSMECHEQGRIIGPGVKIQVLYALLPL